MPGAPALALLSSTAELEKKLRQLLKVKGSGPFQEDVQTVRSRLRGELQDVILLDYDLAATNDAEANLWKLVHYKTIEEFRKKLKEATSRARRAGRSISAEDRKELRVLTSSFRNFLADATAFYLRFIWRLTHHFSLHTVELIVLKKLDFDLPGENPDALPHSQITPELQQRAIATCHRSLIYLGDLARYREIHADRKEKNWLPAKMFYNIAIRLIPSNGNPFNQLAVINTYAGNVLGAVECYFRSLVIQQPFSTAQDNLTILFEKVQKRTLTEQREVSDPNDHDSFAEEFIALHGEVMGVNKSLDGLRLREQAWLSHFHRLLMDTSFNRETLMRLFVVNMAVGHILRSRMQADITESLSPASVAATRSLQAQKLDEIIVFTIDMFRMLLETTLEHLQPCERNSSSGRSLGAENSEFDGALAVIKIVSRWLKNQWMRFATLLAEKKDLWTVYAAFLTAVSRMVEKDALLEQDQLPFLREDEDLEGFLPLQPDVIPSNRATYPVHSFGDHLEQRRRSLSAEAETRARLISILRTSLFFTDVEQAPLFLRTETQNSEETWVFSASFPGRTASSWTTSSGASGSLSSSKSIGSATGLQHPEISDDDEDILMFTPHQIREAISSFPEQVMETPHGLPDFFPSGPMDPLGEAASILVPISKGTGQELAQGNTLHGYKRPLQELNYSKPMAVPGERGKTAFASASPDSNGVFGTSADAVNTMAFLGLGSPLWNKSRPSPDATVHEAAREADSGAPAFVPWSSSLSTASTGGSAVPRPASSALSSGPHISLTSTNPLSALPALGMGTSRLPNTTAMPNSPFGLDPSPSSLSSQWNGEYNFPFGGPMGASKPSPQGTANIGQPLPPLGDSMLSWLGSVTDAFATPPMQGVNTSWLHTSPFDASISPVSHTRENRQLALGLFASTSSHGKGKEETA
ncbi:uncharacterized protein SPPG_04914 [Spizellomyces punctatus DAOM BR117]|uniref:DNA/RNA-binding domain-containing protein n=1 Tax=Spizellomyces punctatus (strain DAOM BR117) TaxID=645134 RepID=A0A0L0HFF6_SPIPD|nr:uncharacterized protein SPPG_04914 [Spizellomyces punctatus DAOM BR117]KNC99523.1 hypothetical protein SPPG_04914 [Spizellomyces punctatus DAOM BR117]|eukprot:XP_016607563.1 hypothetical protein SPPG_04914 [Spizellomyces punctatus DAOM BR117]